MALNIAVEIDSDAILWRTRGKHWDYAFVRTPKRIKIDGWYEFHTRTFSGVLPTRQPLNKGYIALISGQRIPCICTAFQDTVRVDIAGRPITHFVTWFPDQKNEQPGQVMLPADWGHQIVARFDAAFQRIFDLPQDFTDGDAFSEIGRHLGTLERPTQRMQFTEEPIEIRCDNSFELLGQRGGSHDGEGANQTTTRTINALALDRAIIEGEAYALGNKIVPLPSLLSFLTSDKDLPERIAKSFGGSKTDKLVLDRIRGIRDRVRNTSLPSYPRKGFDALVDVIKDADLNWHLSVEQCCIGVASLLNSAPDDEAVRNIVLRVKRLRDIE